MAEATLQTIQQELRAIRTDLDYIKEHIVDLDLVLTEDDAEALREAEKDLKSGKTRTL